MAEACYQRTVFIRPVEDLIEILDFIEHNKHQTLGLKIKKSDNFRFVQEATKRGIERVTEIGKMSYFDYPWDGMFPINQFVRWVSLSL